MTHELESATDMFYTDWQVPWHGLGVAVGKAPDSDKARRLANLDWTVGLTPIFTVAPNNKRVEVPGWKAIARESDGRIFGMSRGGGYTPFQNQQAFEFLDALVSTGDLKFETAGQLYGGKRVWMLARRPESILVGGDDEVIPYILLVNGHDAHTSLQVLPTTVRVVCWNTLNAALFDRPQAQTVRVRIYHTGSLMERVAEARRVLGITTVELATFEKMAAMLDDRDGLPHVDKLLNRLFPAPKKDAGKAAKTLYEVRRAGLDMAVKAERETAWGVLNGVTAWVDHRLRRGKADEDLPSRRMEDLLFERDAQVKAEAARLLMQMTGVYGQLTKEREEQMIEVAVRR